MGFPPRLTEDSRPIVRNAGIVLVIVAAVMVLMSLGSMLWMDVPLALLGLALILYAWLDGRRAPASGTPH